MLKMLLEISESLADKNESKAVKERLKWLSSLIRGFTWARCRDAHQHCQWSLLWRELYCLRRVNCQWPVLSSSLPQMIWAWTSQTVADTKHSVKKREELEKEGGQRMQREGYWLSERAREQESKWETVPVTTSNINQVLNPNSVAVFVCVCDERI